MVRPGGTPGDQEVAMTAESTTTAERAAAFDRLLRDLQDETDDLLAVLDGGIEPMDTPTPAVGWTVRDQLAHLLWFDQAEILVVEDPDRFVQQRGLASADTETFVAAGNAAASNLSAAQLMAEFDRTRRRLITVAATGPPDRRVPWYGPDMSLMSSVTARLMETWAHGQDVADALHVVRVPTARVRHVAHLGVQTRRYSFEIHGRPMPGQPVAVLLTAPDGELWQWGDPSAPDSVRGPALDFCLVVTQRRHLADTALVTGGAARDWLEIAQAFAGPPGEGRRPGQFEETA
jgi:uncharacterized protein (TIGR03084 family)